MPLSPPSLTSESQAKLTLMEVHGIRLDFDQYDDIGWTLFITSDKERMTSFFDAPTADECVKDGFEYFLGVISGKD